MPFKLPDSPIFKKNLPLVIAGISALLAVVLINVYIQQQSAEERRRLAEAEKNKVTVIFAARDIPRGAIIGENMLTDSRVSKNQVGEYAATSAVRVLGKVAITNIRKGEPVLLNKVTAPSQKKERPTTLAAKVPPGKRAVTISVDTLASLAGMVRPGDYADLIGIVSLPSVDIKGKDTKTMTILPLFQDILVLATGQDLDPEGKKIISKTGEFQDTSPSSTVTLALSPQEANIIAFIEEQGKIRLVLRSPQDKQALRTVPADWETVLKIILPPEEKYEPKRAVEVYHGTRKEIIVLD